MDSRLIDFLKRLETALDTDDAWAETIQFMRELGADHVVHTLVLEGGSASHPDSEARFIRATIDDAWMRELLSRDALHRSPVALHCAEHLTPGPVGVELMDRGKWIIMFPSSG